MNLEKNSRNSFYVAFALVFELGIQMALAVVLGLYAGKWGDKYLGTAPWLMIVGLVLGAVAGFYNLIRILKQREKK